MCKNVIKVETRVVLTREMRYKKSQGFGYVVTYNDTDKFFTYKDKYYKTFKGAKRFYDSLTCELKTIQAL